MRGLALTIMSCLTSLSLVACMGVNRPVDRISPPLVPGTVAPIGTNDHISTARRQWEPGGRVYRVNQLTVVTPADCGERRAINLVRNVRFVLAAFEFDHGPFQTNYTVFITDRKNFPVEKYFAWGPIMPPGFPHGPQPWFIQAIGVYCGSTHEIAVVAGALDCLPALYHEFCHALLDVDAEHTDPRWQKFERRGDELAERLRRRWH